MGLSYSIHDPITNNYFKIKKNKFISFKKECKRTEHLCKCIIYGKDKFFDGDFMFKIEKIHMISSMDTESMVQKEWIEPIFLQDRQIYGCFYFEIDEIKRDIRNVSFMVNMISNKGENLYSSQFFRNKQLFKETHEDFDESDIEPNCNMYFEMIKVFIKENDQALYQQLKQKNIIK